MELVAQVGGFDPTTTITGGITELSSTLSGVAAPALGIGAAVLGLMFGWRLVKRFVN